LDQARRRITRRYPTREQVEETYLDVSSGEEMPLYFKEQKQLLEVFTTKEESNLFHIENSQETEQALEDILHRYSEMKLTKSVETNKMKASIAHLEAQIAEQRANCNELKRHINSKEGASEQDSLLAELDKEIVEVHAACGHDSEHDPDTLAMLGAIEKRLEEFLSYIVEYERRGSKEANEVMAAEHRKDKDRRNKGLKHKKAMGLQRNEDRLRQSLERSQAPIHKKVGKQVMFRSAPLFQARRVVEEDDGYEQAMKEHSIFSIWIQRDGMPCAVEPTKSV